MKTSTKIKPDKNRQVRKPYQKPELEQVLLIPEENVLGGCKTASFNIGPGAGNCGGGNPCFT